MCVISEGSTLKSKWSNSLTLFFAAAMGIMKTLNKPCIAYGSGAGQMDNWIYEIAKKYCDRTFFICREKQSLEIVKKMGMACEMGVDTAWTFHAESAEWAEKELMQKASWDGKKDILGVAVINPFCWPVRPDLEKWSSGYGEEHPEEWYESFMFFTFTEERKKLFADYLTNIAYAVDNFSKKYDMHVVIFGMEALDYHPVTRFQKMLKTPAHIFSSINYNGYQMTALLRKLSMLVTSRYHARVLSMPAGIPSIAISMDERLYNLLTETGHLDDYYFEVDDSALGEKLMIAMEKLWQNREKVKYELIKCIPYYLKSMARMGDIFRKFVKNNFPDFQFPFEPKNWLDNLPPLDPLLMQIINKYG
jgi:polysaccharide pyruvyl transferase WcaK-like protein